MKYVLGVDAGNTKTIALVSTLDGRIVGCGRAGCGDIYNADSAEQALQQVDVAVQQALRSAHCTEHDLVFATFSMAGADWPEDFALIREALEKRSYAPSIEVLNDAVGALRAGAVDDWGVAIANGTGAGISARSRSGHVWHTSWWQEGGGGRSLGQSALRAVYKSELGIIGKTALTERVLAFYGLSSVEQLLHLFTKRVGKADVNASRLARIVLDLAQQGDEIACQIVRCEGTVLGDYALAAARQVGIAEAPFPLVLTGSIFRHESPLLTNAIVERVQSVCPGVSVLKSDLEPCAGALITSLAAMGINATTALRARLKDSTPSCEFFAT